MGFGGLNGLRVFTLTKLEKLIKEASNRAELKGHILGEFRPLIKMDTGLTPVVSPDAMSALCHNCGASIGIDPSPPTGLPEVWGIAIKKPCQKLRK